MGWCEGVMSDGLGNPGIRRLHAKIKSLGAGLSSRGRHLTWWNRPIGKALDNRLRVPLLLNSKASTRLSSG